MNHQTNLTTEKLTVMFCNHNSLATACINYADDVTTALHSSLSLGLACYQD